MMNNKVLATLATIGLDLDTGKSNYISVEKLEQTTGRKITGNGSIIRDDSHPWNKFIIERKVESKSIQGFTFKGYRTIEHECKVISSRMENRNKRIQKEIEAVAKDSSRLKELNLCSIKTATLFNQHSL